MRIMVRIMMRQIIHVERVLARVGLRVVRTLVVRLLLLLLGSIIVGTVGVIIWYREWVENICLLLLGRG